MVGDKIRAARTTKGWSQEELAKAAQISRRHVSEIERDEVPKVSLEVFLRILRALELRHVDIGGAAMSLPRDDQHELLIDRIDAAHVALLDARKLLKPLRKSASRKSGVANLLKGRFRDQPSQNPNVFDPTTLPADSPVRPYDPDDEDDVLVQLAGYAAAGTGIEYINTGETARIPKEHAPKENEHILKAVGDSMIDFGIQNGDYLLVERRKTSVPAATGEVVIGWLSTDSHEGLVVKRWYHKRKKKSLISGNESHPPIVLDEERGDRFELQGIVRKSFQRRPIVVNHLKIS